MYSVCVLTSVLVVIVVVVVEPEPSLNLVPMKKAFSRSQIIDARRCSKNDSASCDLFCK